MTTTTSSPDAKASVTTAAINYCDRQHKITINPRRIVYKKRLRRRWAATTTRLLSIILLVLVNEMHLFGVAGADGAADNVLLVEDTQYNDDEGGGGGSSSSSLIPISNLSSDNLNKTPISSNIGSSSGHYLDKIDNLERSVAAVLIKVAYGTTSTTKRSIPDNSYVPSLTTIATPPLTTLRYLEKSQHQQQINLHHRNYELDLERDHALPTSAPNADILKSNSNPTYPNPNRHHNHDRNRHRHLVNSTPSPSVHNLQKKGPPTNPMYSIDMPSYSPPARSFLTPPLPPEYTNPFADKPTLRGTNNDGGIANTGGAYINRRPIPPPSLMPGQERIPFRPPDLNGSNGGGSIDILPSSSNGKAAQYPEDGQRKKALNTPSLKVNNKMESNNGYDKNNGGVVQNNIPLLDTSSSPNETVSNPSGGIHFQGISRILSGSNGRKEDIPEVLLRSSATVRPGYNKTSSSPIKQTTDGSKNPNINQSKNSNRNNDGDMSRSDSANVAGISDLIDKAKAEESVENDGGDDNISMSDNDGFDMFAAEPQPKVKMSTKSTENPNNDEDAAASYSTQIIHNLANINNEKSLLLTTSTPSGQVSNVKDITAGTAKTTGATWTVAWNIHVYLSAILFTILAVYSIFKMIFYDKLTHLFNQSYFICIHLILIIICMTRIFYLCYDAYNIHSSFHLFLSEILLNLPATFLTISFSVLILFLLIRSLNHKNNRYSALIRPLTVVVGSSVLVGLCITLHYVESYTTSNNQQLYYYQQQLYRNGGRGGGNSNSHQLQPPIAPPRVLSLICQIIYIFVCLSLGLLYLYIYRILKRVLRSKSQNYMHGYQNLSYAIHITIATALLYVLLAALQIYGALSISTNRPLITSTSEIDWLQWGYQFSLRLIEIAIITLMSWVAGLKTGGNPGVLQREKAAADTHNVSGFALFPCTSSSSQEHFETDYPAVCNANTNLHTYTLRTGKPIYDDNFALNSLAGNSSSSGSQSNAQQRLPSNDFQIQNASGGDFVRSYETSSLRSASHHLHNHAASHKTGGARDKASADTHNMAGFALFPCTSGSSQEHFEADYPAVCNANTSLHTHTMRTGKPVYDENFAGNGSSGGSQSNQQRLSGNNDFQIPSTGNDFVRSYETSSLRSASRHHHNHSGHKGGVNSRVLQRDKCAATASDAQNNGFALFPCTSSSSQEHFEAEYPPIATTKSNHTHTLRSGKPIYDDNFVLTSSQPQRMSSASKNDFLIANSSGGGGDFVRSYKTSSLRSGARHPHKHSPQILDSQSGHNSDFLDDPQTDHYENPNFELRTTRKKSDNCYSEPLNAHGGGGGGGSSGHGMML